MKQRFLSIRYATYWLTGVVTVGLISGCSDSENYRQSVFGRISGAEGRGGLVSFVPRDSTTGPAARASLVNGEYQFDRTTGPVPGDYTVIIQLEIAQDRSSGVVVFKGIEVPTDSDFQIPTAYEAVASLPVSVPDGRKGPLQVDLKLPGT
ncbi:MAG: hypothetical protein O3B13_07210 [Planctomycetota bacterium]|nr:hypothetical protein [Planctomycetota bacterium]MDA1162872.1 hypothetical protein [Planctomycetota bacterium]